MYLKNIAHTILSKTNPSGFIYHPKLKVIEKEIIELKTTATVLGLNFDIHNIGKTIFLTREEAEKALKDMRNKENEKEDIT